MNTRVLYLALVFAALVSSCIQTSDPEVPSRIHYLFNVENTGNTIEAGGDAITVNEFKISVDKFNVLFPDGGKLESQPDALIMAYRTAKDGEDELVLSADIGFENVNQFNGLELFVAPPSDQDNIQDSDFFGDENNFSLVIKGEFNTQDFIYKSNISFQKDFEFSQVTLTDDNRHLAIRVLSDIENIFIDDEDNQTILDPANEENKAKIDSLAEWSLELDAFATDQFIID